MIAGLLKPPPDCLAHGALTCSDKRKGSMWFCPYARKFIGKGRKRPPCLCAAALASVPLPAAPEVKERIE